VIEIVEGKGVGSGKSYFVLTRLVEHWRRGGTAFVTDKMEILWEPVVELVRKRYGLELEQSQLQYVDSAHVSRLHEVTAPGTEDNPVLIVLDEAQDELNARDWNDKNKRDLFSWCCQSRHDDNDLIFISQASANVDKQVRRLATYNWRIINTEKMQVMGLGNFASAIKFASFGLNNGRYFICNQFEPDGRTLGARRWLRHDKGLFGCYRSKAMRLKRKRGGDAIGKKQLKQTREKKSMIRFAMIAAVFGIVAFGWTAYKRFNKPEVAPVTHAATATVAGHVPGYSVRREVMLSRWPGTLRTEIEDYEAGRLSSEGWVLGVDGNCAKIRRPDGSTLYIVGGRRASGEAVPTQSALDKHLASAANVEQQHNETKTR